MAINFELSREIYGGVPWCVDAVSFRSLSCLLSDLRNGVNVEVPEIKYNSLFVQDLKSNLKVISDEWQLDSKDNFEAIGLINLNGVITKGGAVSSRGMLELSQSMKTIAKDERIKGFIINTDSGGGSSAAVKIMSDAILEVKQKVPVYALIGKGGVAASAAYGIISAANKIFSEYEMNEVGSVGTMIQFEGVKNGNIDGDGVKSIRLYATKSTEKNKDFEQAIEKDNYDLIINNLLDPINESFIEMVQSNRPQLKGTKFDNGHTVFAKDGIGTFIDGIASFDEVVSMIISDSKKIKKSTNTNTNTMNKSELLQNHPQLFNEVLDAGVQQERERIMSWMAHKDTDMESVVKGIESGNQISPSETQSFLVKMMQKNVVLNLQKGNPKDLVTAASTVINGDEPKEVEGFDFELKLN